MSYGGWLLAAGGGRGWSWQRRFLWLAVYDCVFLLWEEVLGAVIVQQYALGFFLFRQRSPVGLVRSICSVLGPFLVCLACSRTGAIRLRAIRFMARTNFGPISDVRNECRLLWPFNDEMLDLR